MQGNKGDIEVGEIPSEKGEKWEKNLTSNGSLAEISRLR